jgi:hypothetical protein
MSNPFDSNYHDFPPVKQNRKRNREMASDKFILIEEKFIYTIGNEIHFSANINKLLLISSILLVDLLLQS